MNAITQFPARASGSRLDNRRVAAGAVDLAVVGLVGAVLRAAAGGEFTAALAAVTVGWGLFYYFVTESTNGQTLGKRLLGLRVERAGGGAADERAIALRTVLRVVDGIGFYVVGLLVMLRSGERRQRLGDAVAGTVVVDAREPAKPTAKSSLKAADAPVAAPEPVDVHSEPEALPHRAEVPSQLFDRHREEEPAAAAEEEEPRVEIVSSVEADEASEPEPELPQEEEPEEEQPAAEEPEAEEPEAGAEQEEDAEESMPQVASPALESLADDVASSASKPRRRRRRPAQTKAEERGPEREQAPADEDITVKPVETVSPMDVVMADSGDDPAKAGKGSGSRSRTRSS